MRQHTHYLSRIIIILFIVSPVMADIEPLEWPKDVKQDNDTARIYQPQLESFDGNMIRARSAVAVTTAKTEEPVFGAVWFNARVETDRDERTVKLLELKVGDVRFADATDEQKDKFATWLETNLKDWRPTLSLDHLLAEMELIDKKQPESEKLNNTPPKIIYTNHPAVLVTIDGDPKLQAIEDQKDLMRIVNTPFVIVFQTSTKKYYLHGGGTWYIADDIAGPWQADTNTPATITNLIEDEAGATPAPTAKTDVMPQIIVVKEPSELISSDGPPTFGHLEGTNLLFMTNTSNDVLLDIDSQTNYVLLSGRWYQSKKLTEGWAYIEPEKLPKDFAAIPPDSPMGHVLAQVPGTQAATDAIHDAYIPQTSQVDRKTATATVTYDGDPKFEAIDGTTMQYAVNSASDVILVNVDNKAAYYCCDQGVWFVSASPTGPYAVCTDVPQVIYTIPASSPVYHVRYVYVYDSTPTVVYVGYTPGYTGCYVHSGVVVYGTGYRYHGWYGNAYYPRSSTWGFRAHYNNHSGSWGFRFGGVGSNGWVGVGYHNGRYVSGGWATGGRWGGAKWFGTAGYRPVATPYGRNVRVGDVNINTGDINVGRQNNLYNRNVNNISRTDVRRSTDIDRNRAVTARDTNVRNNNVYADRNGDVYRRDNNNWQQRSNNNWQNTAAPKQQNLNRQHQSRQHGTERTKSYQQQQRRSTPMRHEPTRGRSGGGARGGRR